MKLKRVSIAAAAAAAMVMSVLAGCGNTAESEKTESTESTATAASEAVNKTGYPIMNEDYTFKIVYPVASTEQNRRLGKQGFC